MPRATNAAAAPAEVPSIAVGKTLFVPAEIASQIHELAFDYLDAPVARIGAPFSPVPFSPALEQHYLPDAASIEAGIRNLVQRS